MSTDYWATGVLQPTKKLIESKVIAALISPPSPWDRQVTNPAILIKLSVKYFTMYLHITYYLHIINIISRSQLGLKGSGKKPFMSILFIVPQQCSYNANHAPVIW